MKLLLLGGTGFLGIHIVETALARGHIVTLFNRGQRNPALFPQLERLRGDRTGDLSALDGRQWDAAIDTSGYFPRIVRAAATRLAGAVDHYTFISSLSAYASFREPQMDESAPLGTLADPNVEEITGETYGPLKALCEQAAAEALPGRVLVVRPGLIVGPHDPTDRFTYWPHRLARGGEVLAPGRPAHRVQFIDARDLAGWIVQMAEVRQTGAYNATGPATPLTLGQLLETCRTVAGNAAPLTWVDEQFLLDAGAKPWIELPLWVPEGDPDNAGFDSVSAARAIAAGLTFRPLADTVHATLAWETTRPPGHEWRAGLTADRERELLHAWHTRPQ
ncbi:MAG TPA: NAD-dependent epimerase/dehydratase family protein [Chloroflexia bacterium]|nr:NAD-dependent epimerase/dehydratase family protein [Chloroflexia bacterium]